MKKDNILRDPTPQEISEKQYIFYDPQGHILAKTNDLVLRFLDVEVKCPICNEIYNLSSKDIEVKKNYRAIDIA